MSHPPENEPESSIAKAITDAADLFFQERGEESLFTSEQVGRFVDAIWGTLRTPNEYDRNGEPANVVDGLFAIARAVHHLARAHEGIRTEDEHDEYHAGAAPTIAEPQNRGRVKLQLPEELTAPMPPNRNGHR